MGYTGSFDFNEARAYFYDWYKQCKYRKKYDLLQIWN